MLLLGADLRKPRIYNDFGLTNDVGLSNYLAGQVESKTIISTTKFNNLDVISAGTVPPNPAELIQSAAFFELLEDLKSNYDFIIIDTPPVGLVADALQILPVLDGLLYIARFNYTQSELLNFINEQYKKRIS